jgi:predicted 3-demethylubiquinone-9 3-methyltransferase (glyoxalase superfamily)
MKTPTPFLWFDDDLEEAAAFYTSTFPDSKVHGITRLPDGKVLAADFEVAGQQVKGVNGGPLYHHTEAFSFFVECADQQEVDHYWSALLAGGGQESQCGWLKDRFGVSWQIIPTRFREMMSNGSPEQVGRVVAAMHTMQKFDVAALEAAYSG